ncbi:hypothetical protein GLAREA_07351 [Glarea lozoyensis ATCC 20868]|uniref:Uncharacterized protein n=1 Tax=Glarea lozoyensis (strain ATCC 20868 / MF5171) TaxID=1116229 RepID=S3E133_GLAL2|nr:uncharacterized protein GLAREA_07351 [Glarea lozoyensis ATCC 20868]EPE32218.1 hypothetical protein GLAREA_07351 [Glarea lozoyensis ATCC 20868]
MAATFLSNLLSLPKRLKTLKIGFDCSRRNESFSRSLDRQNLLCDFDQKALVSALMCQRNSLESLTLTCNNRPVSTNKFHSTMPLRLPMFNFVTQLSIPRLWLVRNGRQGFIDCHYRLPLNVKLLQVINGAGYRMDYGRCGTNEWLMLVLENRPTKLRNLEKVVIIMTKMPKGTRSGDEKLDSALAYEDDTSDDEEETDLKTYIRRAESTPLRRLLWVTTWTLARTVDVKIKLKVQENIEDEPV